MGRRELILDPEYYSTSKKSDGRNIEFFNITGKTLVHPVSYHIQKFQKDIIKTAVRNNTLINLPPGLGKLYIAALIVFNFNRWFLNGQILVISQTRSYLRGLISAFDDYTSLSKEVYLDVRVNAPVKDLAIHDKSIVLTSPQKCVELLNNNMIKYRNLVLLLIFESSKIVKCNEYKMVLDKLNEFDFRIILFVDSAGFSPKVIKQVVDDYKISRVEVRNLDSPDVKECTFYSEIELMIVDISSHITKVKDIFYTVFEKYGKQLKDAKVVTGNVASFSKSQILKAKEKFMKNMPRDMPKNERNDLINSMTIGAFLCDGIELLHNWGIRAFYNYLFDNEKDDELKALIAKDEHLMDQMKMLNNYLKMNGRKSDTSLSLIIHPKILHVKKLIERCFSSKEDDMEIQRIIVLCPVDDVVEDLDRAFRSLSDLIRYYCIKTKAKCLASQREHMEILQNFIDGVINVLVISSLVDEIMEIKTSLIISLDPNKTLLKNADPRFIEGPKKCIFVLAKGMESITFETLFNEKRSEQKTLDVRGINLAEFEQSFLFPEGFDPEFERTVIPKRTFKNPLGQKTIHHCIKSTVEGSPFLFKNSNDTMHSSRTSNANRFSKFDSPSLFGDDFTDPVLPLNLLGSNDFVDDNWNFMNDDVMASPRDCEKRIEFSTRDDELILEFTNKEVSRTVTSVRKFVDKENFPSRLRLKKDTPKKFSLIEKSVSKKSLSSVKPNIFEVKANGHKDDQGDECVIGQKSVYNDKKGVSMQYIQNESFVDYLFSEPSPDIIVYSDKDKTSEKSKNPCKNSILLFSKFDSGEKENISDLEPNMMAFPEESFVDDLFTDSPEVQQINDFTALENDSDMNCHLPPIQTEFRTKSAQNINSLQPTDYDSDCDFIPKSPDAKRSCEIFSSKNVEYLTQKSSADKICNRSQCYDLFLDTTDENKDYLRNFVGGRLNSSCSLRCMDVVKKNTPLAHDFLNDVPNELLSEFMPSCPIQTPIETNRNTSPILFSSAKSIHTRSKINLVNDESTSIRFDSSFDISNDHMEKIIESTVNEFKFMKNFKLDDSSVHVEHSSPIYKYSLKKRNLNFQHDTSTNALRKSSTPKECNFIKSNDLMNVVDSPKYDSIEPPNNHNTPDRILASTDSNTEDLIFEGYSTPVMNRELNSTPENCYRKSMKTHSGKKVQSVIDFNNSVFLDDFSIPNGIGLKEKSLAFDSDAVSSANASLSKINQSKFLMMDRLNGMSVKEDKSTFSDSSSSPTHKFLSPSKSTALFRSNFTQRMKQKIQQKSEEAVTSPVPANRNVFNNDDDFCWLETSPINPVQTISKTLFKKPESPFVNCNSTPVSMSSDWENQSPVPHILIKNHPATKRAKSKRNLAKQFVDNEAEVSGEDEDDNDDCWLNSSHLSADGFIDDDTTNVKDNMTCYLRSLKSPQNMIGKFYIPVLSEQKLKRKVYSQEVDYEQSYENDSFCVGDEEEAEADGELVPSVLTQMEEKLKIKKVKKLMNKSKKKIVFTHRKTNNSLLDSPEAATEPKKMRKRIKCLIYSDSDTN